MGEAQLFPVRRAKAKKPNDPSVLLHAVVIAIRDEACHADLRRLVACYPRIMNRANPYLVLFDEIARLRGELADLRSETSGTGQINWDV